MGHRIKEFGDFQTSDDLADEILQYLLREGVKPQTIIEPTCGKGSFVRSALRYFPNTKIIARDINRKYIAGIKSDLGENAKLDIKVADFFKVPWTRIIKKAAPPVLIVGNPPWVTAADMGVMEGNNIPQRSNFAGYAGLDAITGKSNFDISEWMSIELLKALGGKYGTFAMICKASVARRVFEFLAKSSVWVQSASFCIIDTKRHFNVSTVAGVFICTIKPGFRTNTCRVLRGLENGPLVQEIGYIDQTLVADISLYQKYSYLKGAGIYSWRSGIKHDCASIMELELRDGHLFNGLEEEVKIEDTYLFPLLKSSDIANKRTTSTRKFMLVTQTFIGEDTRKIANTAPMTWEYLMTHQELFDGRKSRIYKGKPQFAIFGVGSYTFSPWKVAISGMYKHLTFELISPLYSKPVVLDDTCYFIPARSREEASILQHLYMHFKVQGFYRSLIFWDSKRPIKKEVLQQLDPRNLVKEIGLEQILQGINAKSPTLDQDKVRNALSSVIGYHA
ncbi:MAG: SAM-dependent methyltransferase [Candidatus Heimdallarchaeota archaeon]